MQRPVLNPMLTQKFEGPPPKKKGPVRRIVGGTFHVFWVILFGNMFFWQQKRAVLEEDFSILKVVRGILYRALFFPIAVMFIVVAFVYIGTHPPKAAVMGDPLGEGMYFETVEFTSTDGTKLEGWLVPVLDAKAIIERKEHVLRHKPGAVILVHDYTGSRQQVLPLVRPLHEAGYVVFAISLRGTGGIASAGTTFGLKEAGDVLAAVEVVRRMPSIDAKRIAVLGVGTGATACLVAAESDALITALVLDRPIANVHDVIVQNISPPQPWLASLRPMCKWTFELGNGVSIEDLDIARRTANLATRPLLLFGEETSSPFSSRGMKQVRDFLGKHIAPKPIEVRQVQADVKSY
jgi:alpha-beta hydrolase superfamily lysophospholipase